MVYNHGHHGIQRRQLDHYLLDCSPSSCPARGSIGWGPLVATLLGSLNLTIAAAFLAFGILDLGHIHTYASPRDIGRRAIGTVRESNRQRYLVLCSVTRPAADVRAPPDGRS